MYKDIKEIKNTCDVQSNGDVIDSRLCVVSHELDQGFDLMKKHPRSVTIFGSARLPENDIHSQRAQKLAAKLAEHNYTVVTGGGPGIMQAANKGAHEAGGKSIGMNIELPFEQEENPYLTESLEFHHFFPRKVALAYSAEAYVVCAGGFGTLDEFFEILTLKQTNKIPQVPIILLGKDFWTPLEDYFKNTFLGEHTTISEKDIDLYTITDSIDEAMDIILSAEVRTEK